MARDRAAVAWPGAKSHGVSDLIEPMRQTWRQVALRRETRAHDGTQRASLAISMDYSLLISRLSPLFVEASRAADLGEHQQTSCSGK